MPETTTAQDAKRAATQVAEEATTNAREVARTAKSEARSVARDARDHAADVLQTARSELRDQASEQAQNLAATLEDFGQQLAEMADASSEPESPMSQLVRSASDTMSQRARRIDQHGIDSVVDDLKRFARNRPAAFLLSSVAVGFAIGRLAKHADLREIADHAKDGLRDDSGTGAHLSPDAVGAPGDALPAPDVSGESVPLVPVGSVDQPTVSEVVRP